MSVWLVFALLGVGTGSLYAAFAIAIIIVYRGSGVVNFAVGAMAMIPAIVYAELRATGDLVLPVVVIPDRYDLGSPWGFWPASIAGLLVGMVFTLVAERLVFRRLRGAPAVTCLVATVGLTVVAQGLMVRAAGAGTRRTPAILPNDVIDVFGRPFPVDRLWITGVVLLLGAGVAAGYRRTRFGIATRAAFLNEKGAILLGLDPRRLGQINWLIATLVAGTTGILASSLGGVSPFNYSLYVVPALAAVLAARLQSVMVAVFAGVGIGMFEAVTVHMVAKGHVPNLLQGGFSSLVPFAVIVVMLIVGGRTLPDRSFVVAPGQRPPAAPPRWWVWWPVIAVMCIMIAIGSSPLRFALLQTLFVSTLLMSVVVVTGFIGQVSLAQLSFAGFAAFMLSRFDGLGFPLAPIMAILLTTVVGTLVSIPALRVRGVLFAIVSFSVAVVFDEVLYRSPTFVGNGGLARVAEPRLFGVDLGIYAGDDFPSRRFAFLALVCCVGCGLVLVGLRRSGLGRRMFAVNSNERAAAASGIDVPGTKVTAAMLASAIAAVAGVMFAYKAVDFTGAGLSAQDGLQLLALAYIGGIGSIGGAVIAGCLAPSALAGYLLTGGGSSIEQYLVTGLALIIVTVAVPGGLAGLPDLLRRMGQQRRSGSLSTTADG